MDTAMLAQKYISRDDIYLFNTGSAQKAWLTFGCRYIADAGLYSFTVWAPHAKCVSLVGDFNAWNDRAAPMTRLEGGVWVCFVEGLHDGDMYKYCIIGADGRRVLKADPFAAYSQTNGETSSRVWSGGSFVWTDSDYIGKRRCRDFMREPMSVYEVHADSWKAFSSTAPAYRQLADKLSDYCRDMGYTHVELLPLTEYPYDGSWGYQVTGYYAPTARYGTPDDFKYFVDTMHSSGIGVILDWVPAHFPRDEHGLASFDGTPLFECKEARMASHPEWGTLIFDYEMPEVQSFLVSSACKFFEEYHIDGIRVDAVSSMLYLNYARKDGEYTPNRNGGNINLGAVEFLRKLNSTVMTNYPGVITIAEESSAFPQVTAPPQVGGLGFCFKWDMGYMHDTLDYMAVDPYFRRHHHEKLTFSMMYAFNENYVLAYSHDEVVHGKLSMLSKMFGDYEQKFASLRTLYGYQFAHPGKKLTFMGSEFGQFIEWNYKQELDWLLLDYPKHEQLRQYSRALNHLYKASPALYARDDSWAGFKWLNVDDRDRSCIAFLRTDGSGHYIVCVSNFTPVRYDRFVIGLPLAGTIKEILNSDDVRFGGSGVCNTHTLRSSHEGFLDMQHSVSLTVPPMSTVYFEYKPYKRNEK